MLLLKISNFPFVLPTLTIPLDFSPSISNEKKKTFTRAIVVLSISHQFPFSIQKYFPFWCRLRERKTKKKNTFTRRNYVHIDVSDQTQK